MRIIIDVGQNETARLNYKQIKNVDLLLMGLDHCVAVIFKDKQGNISITHVDIKTDAGQFKTLVGQIKGEI